MDRPVNEDFLERGVRGVGELLATVRGLFGITFGTPGVQTWESTKRWLAGDPPSDSTLTLDNVYAVHSDIANAISCISEDASSVPWEMRRNETELAEHPVLDLWKNPNELMFGTQLFVGTYITLLLWGEAFWWYPELSLRTISDTAPRSVKQFARDGELYLLDPRAVEHKVIKGQIAWSLETEKGNIPLDPAHLTHFKRYNPYDPIRGLSKVLAVLIEAQGDHAAAEWNERFFNEQNGIPTGLLIPSAGQHMTEKQRGDTLRIWNNRHGRHRSVGILPAGWDWRDLGVSQAEMDFRGLREYSREKVLGMMGVPPFIAGVLDKANYANAREQRGVYWLHTITRVLTLIQNGINYDFLPSIGVKEQAFPKWEFVRAIVQDMAQLAETASTLHGLGIPFEEINRRLDMGFDPKRIEGSEIGYIPVGKVPVGEERQLPPAPGEEEEEEETEEEAVAAAFPAAQDARDDAIWRGLVHRTMDLETRFNKSVRKHFNEIKREVLGNWTGMKGWQAKNAKRLHITKSVDMFNMESANRRLQAMSDPLYRAAMERAGDALAQELGLSIAFDMNSPGMVAVLTGLKERVVTIDHTLMRQLRTVLQSGIDAGASTTQIAEALNDTFGKSMRRSATIARTEIGAAFHNTRFTTMRQSGVDKHRWLSSRDHRVRETHQRGIGVDGEVRKIGERFSNGLMYPLDYSAGDADEVINCRCITVPVIQRLKAAS